MTVTWQRRTRSPDGDSVRSNRMRSAPAGAFALLLLLGGSLSPVAAQSPSALGSVRGIVTDAGGGRGIADVQVVLAGTRRGAVTNESGHYVIVGAPAGPVTVRAQKIGFAPMQLVVVVPARDSVVANFRLNAAVMSLDGVVVTGTPGATDKRTVGNTISTVDASKLAATVPVPNVTELLQGRTAGIDVLRSSGAVGTGAQIRIRGAGSMSANTQPIIYIDGVRMQSGSQIGFDNTGATVQATSALDAIDPNEIESVEVIKGPAASTLYGADAAAGVIQIITKKGKMGQQSPKWSFGADDGKIDWALERPKTYWYCTDAQIANATLFPGCAALGAAPANRMLVDDPLNQPGALRSGNLHALSLSLSGGADRSSYFISGGNDEEQGVLYNNFFTRNNGRANFQSTIRDNLTIGVNVALAHTVSQQALSDNSSNSVLRNAYRDRPSGPWTWEQAFRGFGPALANQYFNQTKNDRNIVATSVNYTPVSWFTNRLNVGLDVNGQTTNRFYGIDTTGKAPWGASLANGQTAYYLPTNKQWTADYAGTINGSLPKNLTSAFSLGVQYAMTEYTSWTATGTGLVADGLNLVGAAATTTSDQSYTKQTSLGTFVQEQVGWRDRLFVTGAVRVDNNSAFGSNFKLATYPKASLSYIISEEPFFHLPGVDQLKLRTAWGRAGNAPKPFTAERAYSATQTAIGDVSVNALTPSAYGNPDLRSETGQEIEAGFDLAALSGRLGLEFTYYNKTTKDALVSLPAPPSTGYTGTYLANLGEISNKGLEATLTATPITGARFTWESAFNFSTNQNKLVSFGTSYSTITFGTFAINQAFAAGYPLGGYWATDVVRDASGAPVLTNGNVTVDPTTKYLGSSTPTREISTSNTFTIFKNLRLYSYFDYKGGFYLFDGIKYVKDRLDANTFAVNDPNADSVQVKVLKSGATLPDIVRGDFIKLRELSLGYTLPDRFAGRLGAQNATLTFSARNLAVWKLNGYPGPDPEVEFYSGVGGTATTNFDRTDYGSIPMTRRLITSLKLTF
jgi:TonB-linked SusC/RagA family outer membrane protein